MNQHEREALLQTIAEKPEDDAPRLVFADWLEEHGEPMAELVRLQAQLLLLTPDDTNRVVLEIREIELCACHADWQQTTPASPTCRPALVALAAFCNNPTTRDDLIALMARVQEEVPELKIAHPWWQEFNEIYAALSAKASARLLLQPFLQCIEALEQEIKYGEMHSATLQKLTTALINAKDRKITFTDLQPQIARVYRGAIQTLLTAVRQNSALNIWTDLRKTMINAEWNNVDVTDLRPQVIAAAQRAKIAF